jgi:hypothetical protein
VTVEPVELIMSIVKLERLVDDLEPVSDGVLDEDMRRPGNGGPHVAATYGSFTSTGESFRRETSRHLGISRP